MDSKIINHIKNLAEVYAVTHLVDVTSPSLAVNRQQYTYDNYDIEDAWMAGYEACLGALEDNGGEEPAEV